MSVAGLGSKKTIFNATSETPSTLQMPRHRLQSCRHATLKEVCTQRRNITCLQGESGAGLAIRSFAARLQHLERVSKASSMARCKFKAIAGTAHQYLLPIAVA